MQQQKKHGCAPAQKLHIMRLHLMIKTWWNEPEEEQRVMTWRDYFSEWEHVEVRVCDQFNSPLEVKVALLWTVLMWAERPLLLWPATTCQKQQRLLDTPAWPRLTSQKRVSELVQDLWRLTLSQSPVKQAETPCVAFMRTTSNCHRKLFLNELKLK